MSYENAATIAAGTSAAVGAKRIPSAEPCAAGFTTTGKSRRSSIAGNACAAPSDSNAVWLKA